jgi:hypothetical protein
MFPLALLPFLIQRETFVGFLVHMMHDFILLSFLEPSFIYFST